MHPEKHLPELMAEKNSLDPSFVHAVRLLAEVPNFSVISVSNCLCKSFILSPLGPHSQQLRRKQLLLSPHSVNDVHGFENGSAPGNTVRNVHHSGLITRCQPRQSGAPPLSPWDATGSNRFHRLLPGVGVCWRARTPAAGGTAG
ncbi:KH domain-containing, RNA-binding, signal transduction-associated protein 2 [Takifugu flavidus]|uniref:KH domain-containing, RNA-binding, signal transduction-associated protein 2 n=1 Tax=Takifugu flavidus TaxID=433684 RepID=A0A5C6PH11_9TELE|nr:KH domain-containing, RNA-binding, signal transduction-associated protein 2 [Takifugu flavidus]